MRSSRRRFNVILKEISRFVMFFLVVSFAVSCSAVLFLSIFTSVADVELTSENLNVAAKATFANVVLLSLIFTVIDRVRRKLTVERSVKYISNAANRIIEGDFDTRISPADKFVTDDSYAEIIECFNRMAEELSGVESLRADFISNVSHELKTPLAAIQNYGRLLQTSELSEEKRIEYAQGISACTQRLSNMMTNILKLNRLENQQIYPRTQRYDLGEQLCESLLQFESVWERDNIDIETDIEEGVEINADAELLMLVWNNLFSNAFKFTESGDKVSLTLTSDEKYAVVRISDTGCGMSADVGEHIFEKFYQGDTSHATEGNGLGLALVKRVVDIVQGEVGVESALGEGTTFTVKIRRQLNE